MPDGSAVAPRLRAPETQATPRLASVSLSAGTPSRGSPAMYPAPGTASAGIGGAPGNNWMAMTPWVNVVRSSGCIALTV